MDFILIAVVLILAASFYFSGWLRPSGEGGFAVILLDGQEYARYSLKEAGTHTISVDGHENKVEIKDGYANIINANCPDKLCVNQKSISLQGETIVCLPNKLVVEIEGTEESSIDGISG